jgi:LysM repeat protein
MRSICLAAVAGALVLSACTGDDAAPAGVTVVTVGATNFVTIPPVSSTIPPVTVAPDAPGTVQEFETPYTIQEGDYPSTIAGDWKVPFEELMAANGWTLADNGIVPEWPGVGAEIIIPAGATVPGDPIPGLTPTTTVGSGATASNTTVAPTTPPTTAGPDCTPGEYTIVENDVPSKVADKFDVTVGALNAANANTRGYSSFYVGLKIVIPC